MNEKNFYQSRNQKNLEKIQYLLEELPPFVEDYFVELKTKRVL